MVSCNKPVPLKIKTPVVNPVGGTYTQAQNVTITCETPSAEIRYTLDGSEPSTSSALYTGAINITSSATLTAKAFKTGWTDSDSVSHVYDITGKVKTPVVNPVGGTYTQAQNVTITCGTPGAQIRYTLDETEPSTSSALYTGAINITSSATLTAKAFKTGWTDSDAVSHVYDITGKVTTPVVNPVGGTYTDAQNVTITCETPGAEIRYTLDGSEPSTSSTLYTGAINLSSSITLKVRAFKSGWVESDIVTQTYIFSVALTLSKCFGGTYNDYLNSIVQTSDGGYMAVGDMNSTDGDFSANHGEYDGWIIKVDSNGNKLWLKCFGGTSTDLLRSIIQTSDGGYIAGGYTRSVDGDISGSRYSLDGWIIKLDSNGNKLWSKCFGGNGNDYLNSIIQTADGGYIAAGETLSNDGDFSEHHGGYTDGWIIKFDSNGNREWSKCFGGSDDDSLKGIIQLSDGGYIAVGNTMSIDGDFSEHHGGRTDGWIIKVSSAGNREWSKCFGGNGNDYLNNITQTSDGGYIAVGETSSTDGEFSGNHSTKTDGWIIKINATDNKVWSKCFGGTDYDSLTDILQTIDGGYMAAGYAKSTNGDVPLSHGDYNGWIIKVSSTGNREWSKCFGGSSIEYLYKLLQADNGFCAVGYTQSNDGDVPGNHGNKDGWIIKIQ